MSSEQYWRSTPTQLAVFAMICSHITLGNDIVNMWVILIQSFSHLVQVKILFLGSVLAEMYVMCHAVPRSMSNRLAKRKADSILLFIQCNPSAPTQRSLSRFIGKDHGKGQRWLFIFRSYMNVTHGLFLCVFYIKLSRCYYVLSHCTTKQLLRFKSV